MSDGTASISAVNINGALVPDYPLFLSAPIGIRTLDVSGVIVPSQPKQALDVDGSINLNGSHLVFDSFNGVINWGPTGT